MRALARRSPLKAYLFLAYLWGGVVFAIPLLSQAGIGVIPVDLPGAAPFVMLAAFGLAAVGGLVSRWSGGTANSAEYRRRVSRFRVYPLWYPAAALLLPIVAIATALMAGFDPIAALADAPHLVPSVLGGLLAAFLLVNWWEEAGWTGFVLDRLQPEIGPIRASVATTWFQAALHLPLVFVAGGVTEGRVPIRQVPLYLVLLFVLPVPVRLLITWAYNQSGKSIPIVGLLHAGLGAATGQALIPSIAPGLEPLWVYGGFAILSAFLLLVTKGQLGHRSDSTTQSHDQLIHRPGDTRESYSV